MEKIKGTKVSKRQLKTESLPFLKRMAEKESKNNEHNKMFGDYSKRLEKMGSFRQNLEKRSMDKSEPRKKALHNKISSLPREKYLHEYHKNLKLHENKARKEAKDRVNKSRHRVLKEKIENHSKGRIIRRHGHVDKNPHDAETNTHYE